VEYISLSLEIVKIRSDFFVLQHHPLLNEPEQ